MLMQIQLSERLTAGMEMAARIVNRKAPEGRSVSVENLARQMIEHGIKLCFINKINIREYENGPTVDETIKAGSNVVRVTDRGQKG